jgi:hypothetical protein
MTIQETFSHQVSQWLRSEAMLTFAAASSYFRNTVSCPDPGRGTKEKTVTAWGDSEVYNAIVHGRPAEKAATVFGSSFQLELEQPPWHTLKSSFWRGLEYSRLSYADLARLVSFFLFIWLIDWSGDKNDVNFARNAMWMHKCLDVCYIFLARQYLGRIEIEILVDGGTGVSLVICFLALIRQTC